MKLYKNEDLCIECKNEFFSKPYDHRDPTPGQLGYCIKCDNCLIKEKKMEFLRERVFTSLNADELRAGDKVIVADCLADLKEFVQGKGKIDTLERVLNENANERFVVMGIGYILAYLYERECTCKDCGQICEGKVADDYWKRTCPNWKYNPYLPKNEKSCTKCRMATKLSDGTLACDVDGFPVDCTPPHDEACSDYKPKTEQKAEKKYRPFKDTDELIKVWCEKGGKWQKRELTMPLIWVRGKKAKDTNTGWLVTGIGYDGVAISDTGLSWEQLFYKYTFLDGTPCGVEE